MGVTIATATATTAAAGGLAKLAGAIELLRQLDPEMPAQTMMTFLTVAGEPGVSMRGLSKRLKIAQSSISRNIAYLSKYRAYEEEGHDLVRAEEDPQDRRTKLVHLTAKGKRLAERLAEVVG